MLLEKSSAAVSLMFVIWKKKKSKVVMNLCKINTKLYFNAYSLSKQNIILEALEEVIIFFSMNVTKKFFQQSICKTDHWKTAFITSHHEHKQLSMSTIKLTNSSEFFQHHMKDMLQLYL